MQRHAVGYDTQSPACAQHRCIAGILTLTSTTAIVCESLLPHQNGGPTFDFILVGIYGWDVGSQSG